MEERTREAEVGMLGCDREVFQRVWSRVSPGPDCPVEPLEERPPEEPTAQPEPEGREGQLLQGLILRCLNDAAVYRGLQRRSRRAREELSELTRRKTHQARRLSAAYFLMSGVRYWPQRAVPVQPPQSFFPVLREGFLAERQGGEELKRLSRESHDPDLAELYRALAEEAGEISRIIRRIVEREA